jgi:CDP-6-deoxy-D-xylo-4-hexulose-3-dehydrase
MHAPVKSKEFWYPTAFCGWGDEEHAAIERVAASGKFTMGEEVSAFEGELAAYHGRKHAVMVNSGSSANLLMVATLIELGQLHRGDTVMVPALAWSTTYAPLIQHGLDLWLFDCDATWNAMWYSNPSNCLPAGWKDSGQSRQVFENPTASLQFACSILGNPYDRTRMSSNIILIEDNCESIGAVSSDGYKTGVTRSVMVSLSFFYSHQLSAIEGGAVLTNDDEYAEMLRMLRSHGWTKGIRSSESFENEYEFKVFGYNVRPLEIHAAIAREQLKKLKKNNAIRRHNLDTFTELTKCLPIMLQKLTSDRAAPFGLAFTVKDRETRLKLVHALRAADIDCRLPTGGSFRLHKYGEPWRDQQTPNADRIHNTGLFLGNAPYPINDKIERAVQVMRKVLLL